MPAYGQLMDRGQDIDIFSRLEGIRYPEDLQLPESQNRARRPIKDVKSSFGKRGLELTP